MGISHTLLRIFLYLILIILFFWGIKTIVISKKKTKKIFGIILAVIPLIILFVFHVIGSGWDMLYKKPTKENLVGAYKLDNNSIKKLEKAWIKNLDCTLLLKSNKKYELKYTSFEKIKNRGSWYYIAEKGTPGYVLLRWNDKDIQKELNLQLQMYFLKNYKFKVRADKIGLQGPKTKSLDVFLEKISN